MRHMRTLDVAADYHFGVLSKGMSSLNSVFSD